MKRISACFFLLLGFLGTSLYSDRASAAEPHSPQAILGGLIGESDELQNVTEVHMQISLDRELNSFNGSAIYRGQFSGLLIGHLIVPIRSQQKCTSDDCKEQSSPQNLQLKIGKLTFHCVVDSTPTNDETQLCRFSFPRLLTSLSDLELSWSSPAILDPKSSVKTLDFTPFPKGIWPKQIAKFDLRYDPGQSQQALFVGDSPQTHVLQRDFLIDWGDPNAAMMRNFSNVSPESIPKFHLFLINAEHSNESPLTPVATVDKADAGPITQTTKLIFDHWPDSKSSMFFEEPVPKRIEFAVPVCPALPTVTKIAGDQDSFDDPSKHAPSIKFVDRCFGACPSSSFVHVPFKESPPTETHIVGMYRPKNKVTRVRVLKTPKPVVLVLSTYSPARWEVLAGPESKIAAIYMIGYDGGRSEIVGTPPAPVTHLPDQAFVTDWEDQHNGDNSFLRGMQSIRRATKSIETSFQGTSNATDFVVPFSPTADFLIAREQAEIKKTANEILFIPDAQILSRERGGFSMMDVRTHATAPLKIDVPSDQSALNLFSVETGSSDIFIVTPDGLRNISKGEDFPLPVSVPPFKFVSAIEYDSKRERFLIVGRNSDFNKQKEQYFYAFYPKKKEWKILASRLHTWIGTLAYYPEKDLFYSTDEQHNAARKQFLWTLTPDLELKEAVVLAESEKQELAPQKLYWSKEGLILMDFSSNPRSSTFLHAWAIDPCSARRASIF